MARRIAQDRGVWRGLTEDRQTVGLTWPEGLPRTEEHRGASLKGGRQTVGLTWPEELARTEEYRGTSLKGGRLLG